MPAPFEVFGSGVFDVYLAPALTAEPAIESAVPGTYVKLGVAGSLDYSEDGIRVRKSTDENEVFALGGYGVRKVFRTRESLHILVPLMDATLEALSAAFNQTAITVLGTPARKRLPLLENAATPTTRALLIKGANSPYMDGGVLQWWIPIVYNTGDTEFALRKADPVVIELDFIAVQDATSGFGAVIAQTA